MFPDSDLDVTLAAAIPVFLSSFPAQFGGPQKAYEGSYIMWKAYYIHEKPASTSVLGEKGRKTWIETGESQKIAACEKNEPLILS